MKNDELTIIRDLNYIFDIIVYYKDTLSTLIFQVLQIIPKT